jgi:hypothetical protein
MKEQNLVKILEYGKISLRESLQAMCSTLELEFYFEKDQIIYTVSSNFFVIDIQNDTCSLIFVNDELNNKLSYIQAYLNNFITKKPEFFYILKYLKACTHNSKNLEKIPDCSKYKCMCNCIVTGEYCEIYNLIDISSTYNIFTHSEFKYPLDVLFNKPNAGTVIEAPENFADIFTPHNYSTRVFEYFRSKDEFLYESKNVKVSGKSIYISNKRCPIASFAFLKGCSLIKSLEYSRIFEN